MWKKTLSIAGAIAILSGVVATCLAVNNYFATDTELTQEITERILLAERLDNKIIMDKINYWATKIERIEEKYEGKQMPSEARQRIRDAQKEIKSLEGQLKTEG